MWYVRVVALLVLLSAYVLSVPLSGQQVYMIQSNAVHKEHTTYRNAPSLTSWSMRHLECTFNCKLITVSDGRIMRVPELYKIWLRYRGIRFIDVTNTKAHAAIQGDEAPTYPTKVRFNAELERAFQYVSEAGPRTDLKKLTSFFTRYYRSYTGYMSQKWLQSQVGVLAGMLEANTTIEAFQHPWPQNTIILRIKGSNETLTRERGITILGAHQDSVNIVPAFPAPGADDDGSGTVTLLETLRALGTAGWSPASDVEFHWYSAEEGGLLGSQAVVDEYARRHVRVYAMMQQDMTAYVKSGTEERLGLVTDYVSPKLTKFVELLAKQYSGIPLVHTKLHYGASDHASWTRAGWPSAFVMEAPFEDCNLRMIHVRVLFLTYRLHLTAMIHQDSLSPTFFGL